MRIFLKMTQHTVRGYILKRYFPRDISLYTESIKALLSSSATKLESTTSFTVTLATLGLNFARNLVRLSTHA
jgi:hypothetical protein